MAYVEGRPIPSASNFLINDDIVEWDVDSWIFDRGSDLLDVINAATLWIEDYERNR